MVSFRLVRRNLTRHKWRSLLTIASLVIAIFLICMLRSLVYALDAGVRAAKRERLIVQSAVSLYVNLPVSYQQKLAEVPGVAHVMKQLWFGGVYQDPRNFFAQFAIDGAGLFDVYPECIVSDEQKQAFLADRQGCLIGDGLAQRFGFKVGDVIPLIGAIYPAPGGGNWEFRVRAIYSSTSNAVDRNTMFFHFDYFDKSIEGRPGLTSGTTSVYTLKTAPGADQIAVMRQVERLYENGPQRVNCVSEAEFQAQFASMIGNVPFLISAIGLGVLVAILLACVDTMLVAFREQTHDVGILKALGFTDGSLAGLMLVQSFVLCGIGGVGGILLAKVTEPGLQAVIGTMFPGYEVTPQTIGLGLGVTLFIGLLAGLVPALRARGLAVVTALRAVE